MVNARQSPFEGTSSSLNVVSGEFFSKLTDTSHIPDRYSPTTAAASYFNANFDENGYVFDGVKIEVNIFQQTTKTL